MRVKEAVSPKTSEPNYSIINKNHNDQIQFPPEKDERKQSGFIIYLSISKLADRLCYETIFSSIHQFINGIKLTENQNDCKNPIVGLCSPNRVFYGVYCSRILNSLSQFNDYTYKENVPRLNSGNSNN